MCWLGSETEMDGDKLRVTVRFDASVNDGTLDSCTVALSVDIGEEI